MLYEMLTGIVRIHHRTFHALTPAQFTSTSDALMHFLIVCVDYVAFGIVQYLWTHQDVQDWVECQRYL